MVVAALLTRAMAPKKTPKPESALEIQGYTVLRVKASERSRACRCLYLRPHSGSQQCAEWPEGKTLIVYNVPPYCREENLRHLFEGCGDIVRIYLQPKPTAVPAKLKLFVEKQAQNVVKIAYVVFRKPKGVQNACKLTYDEERFLSSKDTLLKNGLRAYIKDYEDSLVNMVELEKEAELYMAAYYKRKDQEMEEEKKAEGVPDEDGFIKVTRHGKNPGRRRTEETEKRGHEHIRKRKKKNELRDFYSFQFRETKRQHIADLRNKFEEDKRKVQEMKAARKFRPY